MMALFVAATIAAQTGSKLEIGPYYTDCPNGIAFISGGKQIGLLRVGWIIDGKYESDYGALTGPGRELHYGLSAADGSYQELSWKAGNATIKFRWARTPAGRICGEAIGDGRLVLELSEDSPTCTATIREDGVGILNGDAVGQVVVHAGPLGFLIHPPLEIRGGPSAGWSAQTHNSLSLRWPATGPGTVPNPVVRLRWCTPPRLALGLGMKAFPCGRISTQPVPAPSIACPKLPVRGAISLAPFHLACISVACSAKTTR